MALSVIPIIVQRQKPGFDLYQDIEKSLKGTPLENGDILVISSKYIANSQDRLLVLERIQPSTIAEELAVKYQLSAKLSEIILRESDFIFGGVAGFVLASSDNILAPNAGIDKSNTKKGTVVLYPDNPYQISEHIRRKIFLSCGKNVGIIIVDSRLMPTRTGTSGIAIACAGLEPVHDLRGEKDLDGNPLKVTMQATADNLATIANYKMGEGSDSTPIAIIRNSGAKITGRKIYPNETTIPSEMCVYVRGFKNQHEVGKKPTRSFK